MFWFVFPSIHPDSTQLPGSAAQTAAAAAVCGSSESRFSEEPRPAAADGVHPTITTSCPGPAQAGRAPALRTQPAGHHLPLHSQPPRPPLHSEPHQSPACPAHCH